MKVRPCGPDFLVLFAIFWSSFLRITKKNCTFASQLHQISNNYQKATFTLTATLYMAAMSCAKLNT